MELSQFLILYLVILISIICIILLIVINKTNLRIKILVSQMISLKKQIDKVNRSKVQENKVSSVDEIDKVEEIDEKIFLTFSEKKEQRKIERLEKKSSLKDKFNRFNDFIETKTNGLERFTGEKILDKIGIIVFLTGIAFFVSISIEFEWINGVGRIFFSTLIGALLLLLAYFIRNKYQSFSSVLIGGGVSALIFTVFASFYLFHIIGIFASFILLFFLIAITVFLSIIYNRAEITVIVFITGYLAPFTVPVATENYIILFSYILLLNVGVIIYDLFKKSLFVNVISYIFTFLFYALWLIREIVREKDIPELPSFIFLTVFYIMIFIIMIINNIKENRKFIPIEFTSLIFATGMYYSAGLIIIDSAGVDYEGLFTGLISLINFIYVLILYKKKNYDRNILHLFFGISLIFITLVIPVEMVGNSVTLLWALQACLLLWISQKAELKMAKLGSVNLNLIMLISLGLNLYRTYVSTTNELEIITPIFNRGFLTSLIAIASLTTSIILLKNETKPYIALPFIKINIYKAILGLATALTLYFSFRLELQYAAIQKLDSEIYIKILVGIYNFSFIGILTIPSLIKKKVKIFNILSIAAGLVAIILYVTIYNSMITELRNTHLLSVSVTLAQLKTHYFITLLLFAILIIALRSVINLKFEKRSLTIISAIVFVFGLMYMLSSEIDNYFALLKYNPNTLIQEILQNTHRLPYTLLWGVSALVIVLIGFLFKNKEIRTVALGLYVISLIKLFVFDFVYLDSQDLMLAFIVLGTVLLIISFVFQIFYNSKYSKNLELKL